MLWNYCYWNLSRGLLLVVEVALDICVACALDVRGFAACVPSLSIAGTSGDLRKRYEPKRRPSPWIVHLATEVHSQQEESKLRTVQVRVSIGQKQNSPDALVERVVVGLVSGNSYCDLRKLGTRDLVCRGFGTKAGSSGKTVE
jgi:hypothetical protein